MEYGDTDQLPSASSSRTSASVNEPGCSGFETALAVTAFALAIHSIASVPETGSSGRNSSAEDAVPSG